jgi:hypothetical protein
LAGGKSSASSQQRSKHRRDADEEMLAVVEHEQQAATDQGAGQQDRTIAVAESRARGLRNSLRHALAGRHGRQVDPPDAIRKAGLAPLGDGAGEPGLADAAGPNQGRQPILENALAERPKLLAAADQRLVLQRQVGRRRRRRRIRRLGRVVRCDLGRRSRGRKCMDPNRARDVLQALLAAIDEGQPAAAADHGEDGFADDDSAGLGEGLQARGDVDAVAVDGAVVAMDHVAEMDADPKAHRLRPAEGRGTVSQRQLDRPGGVDTAGGKLEHGEHRITRHVDDPALSRLDVFAKDAARNVKVLDGRAFVGRHVPGKARGVGGEDRHESTPGRGSGHEGPVRAGS